MNLPYSKIFRQAYSLIKTHKFLWIYGLLLLPAFASNFFSFDWKTDYKMPQQININPAQIGMLIGLLAIIGIILAILFFRAKAGIIISVKALLEKKETSFKQGFANARSYYFRLIEVNIGTGLIFLIVTAILAGPVIYFFSINHDNEATVLLFLGLIIYIPFTVILGFTNALAPMFIVLNNLPTKEAFKLAFNLSSKYWMTLIVFSLYVFFISVVVIFGLLFAMAIVAAPFVVSGLLIYDKMGLGLLVYVIGAVGGIVELALFLSIQSAFASFKQTVWVLAFMELVKPIKIEEEAEIAEAAEIAS